MSSKKVIIYLPEGYADWEGAFLMPEQLEAKRDFITVSESGGALQSMSKNGVMPPVEFWS